MQIDAISQLEELSMPRVRFAHDKHTDILEDRGKDCQTCHMVEDGGLVFSYERIAKIKDPDALKKVYHDNCIGCHTSMRQDGVSSGPRDGECRKCHTGGTGERNQSFVMEKALHYEHWSSQDIAYQDGEENCGACHHKYNAEKNVLYWDEGEEQNCRDCHEDPVKEDVRSMRAAAHDQCVRCHARKRDTAEKENEIGPVHCEGCHSKKGRQEIKRASRQLKEKMGEIPRLERGQPQAALMIPTGEAQGKAAESSQGMGPVPFDHRGHEIALDTCRVCHHESLQACNECHTPSGSEKGDFVQLSQAMHETQSQRSCTGCHEKQKEVSSCAGCHDPRPAPDQPGEVERCRACHIKGDQAPTADEVADMDAENRQKTARLFVDARDTTLKLYNREDIPENVTIDVLADEYKAAEMPHRRIVLAMAEDIEENKMAGYFHREKGTLCQGCHHNSPASKDPPTCRSCHGKPFNEKDPLKPGLQAAYHQQCMNCHEAMNLDEPANRDCTACHEKAGQP
ncbi:MAG: cytochrome c family protein [Desulfohalobiaceae bacterium]|nr:cytochrome c family protein [Desulfohalobiaceae bacterium]